MATAGRGAASSSVSESCLSSEQLKRIEENRIRAREKLASRTQSGQQSSLQSRPNTHNSLVQQQTRTSSAQFCGKEQKSGGSTHPKPPVCTAVGTATQPKAPNSTHRDVATSGNLRFTQLVKPQTTIKANLRLISRSRFEIVMPYDKLAIEAFKKAPSNSYNAKSSVWSFGVEVYNKLVSSLQRECPYVELDQIPRPVLSLFQSLSSTRQPPSSTKTGGNWPRVGAKLNSTLMQFQREGVDYCIGCGGRALLADDMGLGKTLQALAVMSYYRSNWPLLIICPSSVRMTWAEACHRWLSSLGEDDVTVVLTGSLSSSLTPITIISYDLATRLSTELAQRKPDAIIVDESHFLKNYKTNRCKAILPLVKSAARCLLLSGTPALSRPIELYTQISALDKSFKVTRVSFGIRYCSAVKNHFGWDFSGASNLNELNLYMQEKFMIRRLKNDVLDQLPSKRRQTVMLDPSMTKMQCRELRKELERAGMCKALERRSALLPLFERTGRLKLPAVRDYILDLLEGGRKLIVFGHHKSVLDSISQCLLDKGYDYIRIDGRTPVEKRQLLCDRFQHDESCLVAVLSITTANAGLTLTASSTVVFAELFWNPGILVQAEDRVYRIGQKNCVNIHYLVARETVDDFIWPLIQTKLTVLNKAGLAVDDFSNTESTLLKSVGPQQGILDFFDKELDVNVVAEARGDNCKGIDDTVGHNGEPVAKTKRKRTTIVELDSDVGLKEAQKRKRPRNQSCLNTEQTRAHNSKKSPVPNTVPTINTVEGGSYGARSKQKAGQSKAGDLASYLISQQQQQSTVHGKNSSTPAVQEMLSEHDAATDKRAEDSSDTGLTSPAAVCCSHTCPQSKKTCDSTGSTIVYAAAACSESTGDGDGEGLLEKCDLSSFDDFDD